jgi:hypothetical protein
VHNDVIVAHTYRHNARVEMKVGIGVTTHPQR